MILMIDNYDSFTYNLVQYLSVCGREVKTIRNDAMCVADINALKPDLVVISPGPGRPQGAGICLDLVKALDPAIPLFGVCLGFQSIIEAFGGSIEHAPYLMHGKVSSIDHDGRGVFKNLPNPLTATRYHSLAANAKSIPDCLEITAKTKDQIIMGVRHKSRLIEGVQFHPESYLTQGGMDLIRNLISS